MFKQALLLAITMTLTTITPVVHADFMDGIRDLKNAVSDVSSSSKEVSSLGKTMGFGNDESEDTSGALEAGDVLVAKINKLKVYKDPSKSSETVSLVDKTSSLVFMGEQANGFYFVTTDDGAEGWVQQALTAKQ